MRRRANTEAMIRAQKRRMAVRTDILNGLTSRTELSTRHGVSSVQMGYDIRRVMLELRKGYEKDGLYESEVIQERMNTVYAKAVVGFERSKKDDEKVRTSYERKDCPDCRGTGMEGGNEDSEEWCGRCEGMGKIVDEVVMREVKGQAGDSSFLRVMLDVQREIARLKGLHPQGAKEAAMVRINMASQTQIQIPGVDLSKVSDEKLLEVLRLLQVSKQSQVEVDTIDVESRILEDDDGW